MKRRIIRLLSYPVVRIGIFVCFFLIGVFGVLSLFQIREIHTEPSHVTVEIDPSQIPMNLLFFPEQKMKTFIVQKYPRVKNVRFIKRYPHRLIIQFTLREPIAFLEYAGRTFAVDEERMLFESSASVSLPTLRLPVDEMKAGKTVSGKGVDMSISIIQSFRSIEDIRAIVLNSDGFLEISMRDTTVFVRSDGDGKKTSDTLHTLLKGFRMKGQVPQVIDLRFVNPVIIP